ncbi:MAG: alpha amylase C-terminal domain-containing protein [Desulfosarcina sp.]|nr:alpha amylase C-terminal domain-containing protein [Desulfobacterales bacterium]
METPSSSRTHRRVRRLLRIDPWLQPCEAQLVARQQLLKARRAALIAPQENLSLAARNHHYFGLHRSPRSWIFREWAPHATAVYLIGEFSDWQEKQRWALHPAADREGVWEIEAPADRLEHGQRYRLRVHWPGGGGDRIPAYARRVVQDPHTLIFNAQIWCPPTPYRWQCPGFAPPTDPILIYESHVGMAQEREGVGSYRDFADNVLPRIESAGYNTVQLMAVQEHPYYGSFGYQISSFFAASSRFGTPEDLKYLVDGAHRRGLRVVMDLVHSHSVSNEVEGLSRFDGTLYQYFHDGPRGLHHAWDSRCFDYAKSPVLQFLLSNCRFWLEEYRFDGFRFDGVTSMLYLDHGLEKAFTSYDDYFGGNVDEDAVVYLALANELIHDLHPDAVTIAEDISGLPGLALPLEDGGVGFDYRFAMGVPDYWIRLTKDTPDKDWSMEGLWHELTNRRAEEKSISYAESHDQALVGDKTLIFRMADAAIYGHMHRDDPDFAIDRAMALHKMIRLLTLATAGHGYLNFMGNEFGHPEWIDFPRASNQWSYRYARRQWHLADNPDLKYRLLAAFDRAMLALVKQYRVLEVPWGNLLFEHNDHKVLVFERHGLLFVFHFDPAHSRTDYRFPAPPGKYRLILTTDAPAFGGHGRLAPEQEHFTLSGEGYPDGRTDELSLYLPSRTAQVLFKED